jgi:hypothetical protein
VQHTVASIANNVQPTWFTECTNRIPQSYLHFQALEARTAARTLIANDQVNATVNPTKKSHITKRTAN